MQEARPAADIRGMESLPDTIPLDDAIRSALGRAHALGEPSAVLVLTLAGSASAEAEEALLSGVRAADVAEDLGDGTFAVVLYGVGRLPAAAVAERLERRAEATQVGMTLVVPWDRRDAATVLRAARKDLGGRLERDDAPVRLAAA